MDPSCLRLLPAGLLPRADMEPPSETAGESARALGSKGALQEEIQLAVALSAEAPALHSFQKPAPTPEH